MADQNQAKLLEMYQRLSLKTHKQMDQTFKKCVWLLLQANWNNPKISFEET